MYMYTAFMCCHIKLNYVCTEICKNLKVILASLARDGLVVYLALWSGLCTPTEGARSDILTTPRDLVAKLRRSSVYLLVRASCVTVTLV